MEDCKRWEHAMIKSILHAISGQAETVFGSGTLLLSYVVTRSTPMDGQCSNPMGSENVPLHFLQRDRLERFSFKGGHLEPFKFRGMAVHRCVLAILKQLH